MSGKAALSERETALLARRVAIRQVRAVESWLEWEDLPYLGEFEFERLVAAVEAYAATLDRLLKQAERVHGVDSAYALEIAESGAEETHH